MLSNSHFGSSSGNNRSSSKTYCCCSLIHLALIVYTFLLKLKTFLWVAVNLICIKQVVMRVKAIFLY